MDFIFMLTRDDRTVEDCHTVLEDVSGLGLRHIGFKDIGADGQTLETLNAAIKSMGMTSYMEVVSTDAEACLESVRTAARIGVDRLLGGFLTEQARVILDAAGVAYFPFPGTPRGHPTRLYGSSDDIRTDCRRFMAAGCAGADLLAFRAEEAAPLELVRAAREGLGEGYLIVAGSIDSAQRIDALSNAGADAFTIGSAIFERAFSPEKAALRDQLADVLTACRMSP